MKEKKEEKERRRRSLDLIFRMKDSSSRAFTRSTRAFQRLPEYEQETARDDNAEELYVAFPALYFDESERRITQRIVDKLVSDLAISVN